MLKTKLVSSQEKGQEITVVVIARLYKVCGQVDADVFFVTEKGDAVVVVTVIKTELFSSFKACRAL